MAEDVLAFYLYDEEANAISTGVGLLLKVVQFKLMQV